MKAPLSRGLLPRDHPLLNLTVAVNSRSEDNRRATFAGPSSRRWRLVVENRPDHRHGTQDVPQRVERRMSRSDSQTPSKRGETVFPVLGKAQRGAVEGKWRQREPPLEEHSVQKILERAEQRFDDLAGKLLRAENERDRHIERELRKLPPGHITVANRHALRPQLFRLRVRHEVRADKILVLVEVVDDRQWVNANGVVLVGDELDR